MRTVPLFSFAAATTLALCAAPTAHALPPLLVAFRDRQHGRADLELSGLGTGLAATDGDAIFGAFGGGVAVAYVKRGFWPDWSWHSEWAVEGRVRVLAPTVGQGVEVPMDLLVRYGFLSLSSHLDTSGWPTEVFEPDPLIPYLAFGGTVDVATGTGTVRGGPVAVAGVRWWPVDRLGFYAEVEVRALFGDARPIGQVGGSLGVSVGL